MFTLTISGHYVYTLPEWRDVMAIIDNRRAPVAHVKDSRGNEWLYLGGVWSHIVIGH